MLVDKDKCLTPNSWVWVVQDESPTVQLRQLGIFLSRDHLGDAWVVVKDGNKFIAGQYSIGDLVPLHSCTGWDYIP